MIRPGPRAGRQAIEYVTAGVRRPKGGSVVSPWTFGVVVPLQQATAPTAVRLIEHCTRITSVSRGWLKRWADLLMQVGVPRPDGSMAMPAGPAAEPQPGINDARPRSGEPGKIWTPRRPRPQGEKPKIWMPGWSRVNADAECRMGKGVN